MQTARQFFDETSPVAEAIRREMMRGKKARDAMDFVCGEGSYAKFARQVYDACRAQTGYQHRWDFGPSRLGAVSK